MASAVFLAVSEAGEWVQAWAAAVAEVWALVAVAVWVAETAEVWAVVVAEVWEADRVKVAEAEEVNDHSRFITTAPNAYEQGLKQDKY